MPTENHSGSMSNAQQKHMEGERPASPQPHGRNRDGQARVEHICPGWWALEWTHMVQAPKDRRMAFDRLTVSMKAKKKTNAREDPVAILDAPRRLAPAEAVEAREGFHELPAPYMFSQVIFAAIGWDCHDTLSRRSGCEHEGWSYRVYG
ncbi:hypothetical protein PG991_009385 [Apiospora marii]|uniref:Uncharacterized protein n=1 Tax=Apiospora marii TaxID=335849 RepID=A0ABR1RLJ6_9PEZI